MPLSTSSCTMCLVKGDLTSMVRKCKESHVVPAMCVCRGGAMEFLLCERLSQLQCCLCFGSAGGAPCGDEGEWVWQGVELCAMDYCACNVQILSDAEATVSGKATSWTQKLLGVLVLYSGKGEGGREGDLLLQSVISPHYRLLQHAQQRL